MRKDRRNYEPPSAGESRRRRELAADRLDLWARANMGGVIGALIGWVGYAVVEGSVNTDNLALFLLCWGSVAFPVSAVLIWQARGERRARR